MVDEEDIADPSGVIRMQRSLEVHDVRGLLQLVSNSGRVVRLGSLGKKVARVQSRLLELGFDPGPVDSAFGILTDEAVRAFQRAYGLRSDGKVGPRTMEMLWDLELPKTTTMVRLPEECGVAEAASKLGVGAENIRSTGAVRGDKVLPDQPLMYSHRRVLVRPSVESFETLERAILFSARGSGNVVISAETLLEKTGGTVSGLRDYLSYLSAQSPLRMWLLVSDFPSDGADNLTSVFEVLSSGKRVKEHVRLLNDSRLSPYLSGVSLDIPRLSRAELSVLEGGLGRLRRELCVNRRIRLTLGLEHFIGDGHGDCRFRFREGAIRRLSRSAHHLFIRSFWDRSRDEESSPIASRQDLSVALSRAQHVLPGHRLGIAFLIGALVSQSSSDAGVRQRDLSVVDGRLLSKYISGRLMSRSAASSCDCRVLRGRMRGLELTAYVCDESMVVRQLDLVNRHRLIGAEFLWLGLGSEWFLRSLDRFFQGEKESGES